MKTFSPTPKDINHEWFVVDAQDQAAQQDGDKRDDAASISPNLPVTWTTATLSSWSTAKRSR